MWNYALFLKDKIKGYSLSTLIRLEIESLCFGLAMLVPTTIGVIIRGLFAKLFFKKCTGFAWIQPRIIFIHTDRITVGKNFGINSGTYINGIGEIEIGNYVLIGSNVTISSGKHPIEGWDLPIFSRQTIPEKITIEDDVWIGAGAVIMPGITLRKGTVVGANSVVTKSTQPYSVVAGVPAKLLRFRENALSD
ncbi:acyltransferase [Sulfurospirillum sp.]|uniref:acyltransferase n=1 Tax=Sulfurospirillum sp. TaxID=2053622 RepID=UPI002FDDD951